QCERSLLLSDQSILKSRHSKYLLRGLRLEDCPLDRTALLVDNYRHRLGLEPENLAEILDLPLFGRLYASNGNARVQAMNAGEPLPVTAPKDPFCDDLQQIAVALLEGRSTAQRPSRGWLARWLGRCADA